MASVEEAMAARRARVLLAGGVALGIALAAVGLVRGAAIPGAGLAPGEVARVNGAVIRRDELERLVEALAADKRSPMRDADRARVLDRLIEEELLVQRAVEIGLVDSDPSARKALVQALIESVVADAEAEEPDAGALRAFFDAHREYFGAGLRLRVERLAFRERGDGGPTPRERAEAARRALGAGGEGAQAVREGLADAPLLALPNALLPPAKLREYLGPEAVEVARSLPEGSWSEPLAGAEGFQLLRVAERREAEAPPFERVADQVAAEWRREQGDRALREYLALLRAEAELLLAPDAPRP
jgi:parvulin-like peptidyl-prolyl isomerase